VTLVPHFSPEHGDAGRSAGWKLMTTDAAGYFEVEGLAFGSHWALVDGHVVHFQAQQGRFARLEVREIR
jgi:hypothetical protein